MDTSAESDSENCLSSSLEDKFPDAKAEFRQVDLTTDSDSDLGVLEVERDIASTKVNTVQDNQTLNLWTI